MLDFFFQGLFNTDLSQVITIGRFLLCMMTALAIGLLLAYSCRYQGRYTKSFLVTLMLLPAVVCTIIMMVSGSVGAGVAVAGAFSLVRFRSAPGTGREITMLFLAMGAGLIVGMGYLAFALLFAVIMSVMNVLYNRVDFGEKENAQRYRTLSITIPESLDYSGVFDEVLRHYATDYTLTRVKTTNMGSMFRLSYDLTLREGANEKELIDHLRCRNGNLEIMLSMQESAPAEL